jgi:hypothetical protein
MCPRAYPKKIVPSWSSDVGQLWPQKTQEYYQYFEAFWGRRWSAAGGQMGARFFG